MKTKLQRWALFLTLALMLTLVSGCGTSGSSVAPPQPVEADESPTAETGHDPSGSTLPNGAPDGVDPTPSGPPEGEPPTETPPDAKPDDDNPLARIMVTEAEARAAEGTYLVKENGEMYSLNSRRYGHRMEISGLVLFAPVDEIVVELHPDEGDQVWAFGSQTVTFDESEQWEGYGLPTTGMGVGRDMLVFPEDGSESHRVIEVYVKTMKVVDPDTEEVLLEGKDVMQGLVPEKKTYRLEWFEGTTYFEMYFTARNQYKRSMMDGPTYQLEGDLHKEGYASFDLSEVPDGLYYLTASKGASVIVKVVR